MDIRNLTRKEALKLHRQMWTEMQEKLGNNPSAVNREDFKSEWCDKKFPDYIVAYDCFLCEYGDQRSYKKYRDYAHDRCKFCPIDWRELSALEYGDGEVCKCYHRYINGYSGDLIYKVAPISDLLALPERSFEDEWK